MFVVGLIALLACGCGRIAFEAISDAAADTASCVAVGHDEDGDGFDDACDACPQLTDNQADADGDGVGDACDLATTLQQRVFFDPFTGPRTEWNYDGREVFAGDELQYRAVSNAIVTKLVQPPGRETFEVGGTITAVGPGTSRQLTIQVYDDPRTYFCELIGDDAVTRFKLTYSFDGVGYPGLDEYVFPRPFDGGAFRMILDHDPPDVRCHLEWNGERKMLAGAIPAGISPLQLFMRIANLDVDASSFVRLSTP